MPHLSRTEVAGLIPKAGHVELYVNRHSEIKTTPVHSAKCRQYLIFFINSTIKFAEPQSHNHNSGLSMSVNNDDVTGRRQKVEWVFVESIGSVLYRLLGRCRSWYSQIRINICINTCEQSHNSCWKCGPGLNMDSSPLKIRIEMYTLQPPVGNCTAETWDNWFLWYRPQWWVMSVWLLSR